MSDQKPNAAEVFTTNVVIDPAPGERITVTIERIPAPAPPPVIPYAAVDFERIVPVDPPRVITVDAPSRGPRMLSHHAVSALQELKRRISRAADAHLLMSRGKADEWMFILDLILREAVGGEVVPDKFRAPAAPAEAAASK